MTHIQSIMECAICLVDSVSTWYKCVDPFCNCLVCGDCLKEYVKHMATDSLLPKCVRTTCRAIYLYAAMKHLGPEAINNYETACKNHLVLQNSHMISTSDRQKQIVEKLRKEKAKYLYENFPIAIAEVAQLTCKNKLHACRNKVEEILQKHGRYCMNLFCNGLLDEQLTCMLCASRFCLKCEQLLTPNHVCKPEEIESITMSRSFPKCPKCGLNVDKDNACDNVRCGVCGTAFIYRTTQLGGSGGHTVPVEVKTKVTLSSVYKDRISSELLEELLKLEGKEIKSPSYAPVLNCLRKVMGGEKSLIPKLMRSHDRYHHGRSLYTRYIRYLTEIEGLILKDGLSLELLTAVNQQV